MGSGETKEQSKEPDNDDAKNIVVKEPEYEIWKPDRSNPALANLNEDDKKTLVIRRSVTGILNKLTPENFSTLSEKMKNLPIDTSARMQQVVETIHRKAISEWKFRALYANICDVMQDVKVVNELGIQKSFSLYLIVHCETFFLNSLTEDFRFDRQKHEIHLCSDQEIRKSLMRDYEENERAFRKKSIGNCQFIGELFKVYLIHPKIIFLMLDRLLKANGNMAVECVCGILTTIGPFYEEKIRKLPVEYFNKLELLLPKSELSSRIRFMIQDVLDLKENSWRFKRLPELPKTLQQIEQEIIEEEKIQKLSESMSRLKYILNKSRQRGRFFTIHQSEWTEISMHFFKDTFEPKNTKNDKQSKSSVPTSETHSFEDSVHDILDKLTSTNFKLFSKTMKNLPINNMLRLRYVVDSIFEQSMDKPDNCKLYAEMCNQLQNVNVPDEEGDSSDATKLKTLIINKCQQQFDSDKTQETEENRSEFHRKSVVNCRLMGELFNVQIIHLIIMLRCVNSLLNSMDKESLECLYELLNVAGKNFISKLEQQQRRESNKLFDKFQNLLENGNRNLSPEMKSLLEDLVKMRKNNELLTWRKTDSESVTAEKPEIDVSDQISDKITTAKKSQDKEQAKTIAPSESTLSLENGVSEVLESFTSDYLIPVSNVVEEVSINTAEELSPPEKSCDSGKLSAAAVKADSSPELINNETVSHKTEQTTVESRPRKYTSEFLKSSRDLVECKKLLKVNIPAGMYSDAGLWKAGPKTERRPVIRVTATREDAVPLCSSKDGTKSIRPIPKTDEELYKSFTAILNELTPEKFDLLAGKVKNLPINNVPRLQGVVDLICNKAIDEPDNCKWCAIMCRVMQNVTVPNENDSKMQTFRILLINKCQQLFERNKFKELDMIKKQEEIDACTDPEMKKRLQLLLKESEREFHRISVGNCRLIGELFNLQMITAKITLRCITRLLESIDDESLECTCTLLKISGKDLELKLAPSQKKDLNSHFEKMKNLSENENQNVSSRIRSMLKEVITLKENNWVPRCEADNSEMIEQTDAKLEHKEQQIKMMNLQQSENRGSFSMDEPQLSAKKTSSSIPDHIIRTDEELYNSVANILNEFTPVKFDSVIKKLQNLPINNVARLQRVVDLIHTEAVDKPDNCQWYIEMCRVMEHLAVPNRDTRKLEKFRKVLRKKCWQELDRNKNKELNVKNRQKEIKTCKDLEMKKQLQLCLEKDEREFHRKSMGNYRFIGELIKLKIVSPRIIRLCIRRSLAVADDGSLECLCTVLKIIEQDLELCFKSSPSKYKLKQYFKKMRVLSTSSLVSSRIRLMLQEVIALRENNWVPRCEADNSEMIEQTDTKLERKEQEIEMMNLQQPESRGSFFTDEPQLSADETSSSVPSELSTAEFQDCLQINDEVIYNSVASILNKFTPEEFDSVIEKLQNLPINNVARLQRVVDLIHNEAIDKPDNCQWYAEMCCLMKHMAVPKEGARKMMSFHKLLVMKCRQGIDRNKAREFNVRNRQTEIEWCTDPEMKKQLQSYFEKSEREFYRKSVGNYRFIGELSKLKVVEPRFIRLCFMRSLAVADDESLECLCTLLKIIAKDLELNFRSAKHKKKLELYFEEMRELSNSNLVSSRIIIMLKEVINLKKNEWVPLPRRGAIADNFIGICNEKSDECKTAELDPVLKNLSIDEKLKKNICEKTEVEIIPQDVEISSKELPATELFRMFGDILKQWTPRENLPCWVESTKHKWNSKELPAAISEQITFVIKTDPQKAENCGHLFVCLLKCGYIQSQDIVKGLRCLLNKVENQQISTELELVLSPLFENGYLKLDDLNTIFQSNSDSKPIAIEDEEKETRILQNKSVSKESIKTDSSDSQPTMPNIHGQKAPSLTSFSDPCSSASSSTSDLTLPSLEGSERTLQSILYILKYQTRRNFKACNFKNLVEKIPFQKAKELEIAAFYIIDMVVENPTMFDFYPRLCRPMMMLTAEKVRFWMMLMKACNTYFHHVVFPQKDSSKGGRSHKQIVDYIFKTSKEEVQKNGLIGFCRFFSLLVNQMNNDTGNATAKRIMKKSLETRQIEFFCVIYDHLDWKSARFEKSLFDSRIPELLLDDTIEIELREMLTRVAKDFKNREKSCMPVEIAPKKKKQQQPPQQQQHEATKAPPLDRSFRSRIKTANPVTEEEINSEAAEAPTETVTEEEINSGDDNAPTSNLENCITSVNPVAREDTDSEAAKVSTKDLKNSLHPFPVRYMNLLESKQQNDNSEEKKEIRAYGSLSELYALPIRVNETTVHLYVPSKQPKSSTSHFNLSKDQSEPSITNSNLPKKQSSDIVSKAPSSNDEPSSMSHKEINDTAVDVLNKLQSRPKSFLTFAKRLTSMPIDRETKLASVAHVICNRILDGDKNGQLYVILCENMQDWNIIDRNTGKTVSFKSQMITVLHVKCQKIMSRIEKYKKNAKSEEDTFNQLLDKVTNYCRFLFEVLKSPVFCSDALICPAIGLLLLDPIDKDIMELLNEFLKILRDDLALKLEILENQFCSSEAMIKSSTKQLEEYLIMFKIITFLRDIIDFHKYDFGFTNSGKIETSVANENEINSGRELDQETSKTRNNTRSKDIDSFLENNPDFIANTVEYFKKEHENAEELIDSITRSACRSFLAKSNEGETETDTDDESSYAILFKIFSKNIQSFELRCINTVFEFAKSSNLSTGILSKMFEFLFLYEVISQESFVRFKNVFVSEKISEIIKMLNSPTFQEYKLSEVQIDL